MCEGLQSILSNLHNGSWEAIGTRWCATCLQRKNEVIDEILIPVVTLVKIAYYFFKYANLIFKVVTLVKIAYYFFKYANSIFKVQTSILIFWKRWPIFGLWLEETLWNFMIELRACEISRVVMKTVINFFHSCFDIWD